MFSAYIYTDNSRHKYVVPTEGCMLIAGMYELIAGMLATEVDCMLEVPDWRGWDTAIVVQSE